MTESLSRLVIIALATPLGYALNEIRPVAPLSPTEWSNVREWLEVRNMAPADLIDLAGAPSALLGIDHSLSYRVSRLLERLGETRRAESDLAERGIWILTSGEKTYPSRWRAKLGRSAPPVLYGEGRIENLGKPLVGIVGSRDIPESLIEVANDLGTAAVLDDYGVVSGGARGTDRMGMQGVLDVAGIVVSIVPDHLQRDRLRRPNREDIDSGHLTMVSAVHPNTSFVVGNAMYRNRLIYALSNLTLVVATSGAKGGTWAGATQNLKQRWAPLAVWTGIGAPPANRELIALGAFPFDSVPETRTDMRALVDQAAEHYAMWALRAEKPSGIQLSFTLPDG